jgi:oleate hydratase
MAHCTSGNYDAFVASRPPPHNGNNKKTATIVGSGLAGLSAAVFLIRDGFMPGEKITILESAHLAGGALDGLEEPERGFVIRGGRELENHYECLWDLFRSIPSLEVAGSVLDEVFWLNVDDPNVSLCRVTEKRGVDAGTEGKFDLSAAARGDITNIFLATTASLENKRITDVVSKAFLTSTFWLYWRTMFAFEEWHAALEFKLYLHRFIHHIGGLPDLSALKFTKYNQYESFVLPLRKYLLERGVEFQFGTTVTNVEFDITDESKVARRIHWTRCGQEGTTELTPDDLALITIGSLTDNSDNGDHATPAKLNRGPAPAWDLWRRIAAQTPDESFGHPNVFGGHVDQTKWQAATVTLDARIPAYIAKIAKRDPFSGKVVTGGIVTARDSKWLLSWTVNRQPHFKNQPKDQIVVWVYALFVDTPGDYVPKPMAQCTGEEITQEWLYHLGVPVADIPKLAAKAAKTVPTMMPYVTSFFMPRAHGDRPDVIPQGAHNFAFLGQFAESATRDVIFTTEYSVRTAMEAAYGLLGVERGIPEVWSSAYDVRALLAAETALRDGQPLGFGPQCVQNYILGKLEGNALGQILANSGIVPDVREEEARGKDKSAPLPK